MADLSGATNGLVILASVTLAITQHFQNNLKARFSEAQTKIKDAFAANSEWITEQMRKQYDDLRAKKIGGVTPQMLALFIILFVLGILKSFDLFDGIWNGSQPQWQSFTRFGLFLATLVYTGVLAWIASCLGTLSRIVRDTERAGLEFVNLAEALGESHRGRLRGSPTYKSPAFNPR